MIENSKKILIVYFSASGNTRFIAEEMAKSVGADLAELVPKKKMNISGLGYLNWGVRQLVGKEERELEPLPYDLSEYDLIIVGTPVWTFTMTPPVRTFLKEYNFDGKDIALFCCHGGDYAHTLDDMKEAVQKGNVLESIDFMNALELDKEDVMNRINKWMKSMI